MREKEADVDFCRCPFFACRFMSIEDLEMHMATLGSNEEAYSGNSRRTHGKVGYGRTSFP